MLSDSRRIIARRRPYALPAIVLGAAVIAYGCEPDLDSLTSEYALSNSGTAGIGGASGTAGAQASGGDAGGDTQTENAGAGGDPSRTDPLGESGGGREANNTPSCQNGKHGADESDVDCGGPSDCDRCEKGKRCTEASDCKSGFCSSKGQCDEPSCDDGEQNHNETDVDCGGSCGKKCTLNKGCRSNNDCTTAYCTNDGVCGDHCQSGAREADETDIDCGGSTCGPCDSNQSCSKQSDCKSSVCSNKVCASPSCGDEIKNQDESDVDCGGVCSSLDKACALGERCNTPVDCASYICGSSGICNPDLEVPANALIDDMEDQNLVIEPIEGRKGTWYSFGDDSGGTRSSNVVVIPGTRGALSKFAIHAQAQGFTRWGAGVGFDLDQRGSTTTSKVPYDASKYVGITFWGRAASASTLSVVFPDKNTDPAGGICTAKTTEFPDGGCDHHWLTGVAFGTEWKRYTIEFASLTLEAGGNPIPEAPATDGLISVQFRAGANVDYDIWIDDVAFLSPAP